MSTLSTNNPLNICSTIWNIFFEIKYSSGNSAGSSAQAQKEYMQNTPFPLNTKTF